MMFYILSAVFNTENGKLIKKTKLSKISEVMKFNPNIHVQH